MNKANFPLFPCRLLLGPLLLGVLLGDISTALAADDMLPQQSQQIETLQRRAEKLAFEGLDANNYHLDQGAHLAGSGYQ